MATQDEFELATSPQGEGPLQTLRGLIREAVALEQMAEQQENDLKATRSALHAIKTQRIPDAMAEIQSDRFNFQGWEVRLKDFVSGSLPKDAAARERAIALLVSYGGGGLIKTEVKTAFGRTQHNEAFSLAESLRREGFAVDVQSGVNTQTLLKFARERISSGEPIDLDALGLFTGRVAEFREVRK